MRASIHRDRTLAIGFSAFHFIAQKQWPINVLTNIGTERFIDSLVQI